MGRGNSRRQYRQFSRRARNTSPAFAPHCSIPLLHPKRRPKRGAAYAQETTFRASTNVETRETLSMSKRTISALLAAAALSAFSGLASAQDPETGEVEVTSNTASSSASSSSGSSGSGYGVG